LQDAEGNPVPFKQEHANIAGKSKLVLAEEILSALPIALCLEFYTNVMNNSVVKPSAEKNSEPGSSLSNSSETGTAAPALQPSESSGDMTGTRSSQ
jgi:hypothetical protein